MIAETELLMRAFAHAPAPMDAASALRLPEDAPGLIAHILERYHETHRREFPRAIELAVRVEAAHAGEPTCPAGLADHLALMADDLEGHQQKEERVLFPLMLQGAAPRFPIERMMAEHRDVYHQLDRLAELTRRFTPPPGACARWQELCRLCAKLDRDLRDHMAIENEVLFPRFL